MVRLKEYLSSWLSNRNRAIWTASILAFLIRIGTSVALETYKFNPARDHWAFGYEWARIAKWLAERNMFSLDGTSPTSGTDPLYAFTIAPFFHVFGSYATGSAIALILFQSLLCALTTWAIFVLAEKIYGAFEARVSALLFAFYPASIFFAVGRIAPSSLSVLLLSLIFMVVVALPKSRGYKLAVLSGLLMGLSVLTSSKTLSLFLIIPMWLVFLSQGERGRMIVMSMLFISTATVVILPWSVRNSTIYGQPSLVKTNLGYHLWVGNNPHATGRWRRTNIPDTAFSGEEDKEPSYLQMAMSWAAQNPQSFLILTVKRIKYFWYQIPRGRDDARNSLHTWIFMTALILSVLGVLWSGDQFHNVGLLLLFFAIFPVVFYLTHVGYYRHRFHIEPFILILSSHGLHGLWTMLLGGTQTSFRQRSNVLTDHP